jgi:hypothetical protein
VFTRRFRAHAYVGILGDDDDGVVGPLYERSSQSCLSNVTVQHGKPLGLAVVLQNEVLAYFQPVPPIWPQGARFCADNSQCVKSLPRSVRLLGELEKSPLVEPLPGA